MDIDSVMQEEQALDAVKRSLRHVHIELKEKDVEISNLRLTHKKLKTKFEETKDLLKTTHDDLQVKGYALQENEERTEETFRTLSAEEAGLAQLKEDEISTHNRIAFLEKHNKDLKRGQATDSTRCKELEQQVGELARELETMSEERAAHKAVFKAAQTNLQIEMDAYDMERSQWKDRSLLMLRKLEHEQQQLAANNKKGSELNFAIDKITEQNTQLDQKLEEQEQMLQSLVAQYSEAQQRLEALKEKHRALGEDNQQGKATTTEAEAELQKSSDQLRVMAEKVFQLLNQLQKMDTWKSGFVERNRKTQQSVAMFTMKCRGMQGQMKDMERERKRSEDTGDDLQTKLAEQRKEEYAYKKEYLRLDKTKTVLKKKIKMKNTALAQMTNRHVAVQDKFTQEHQERQKEKSALSGLTQRLEAAEHSTQALKTQLSMLELSKVRQESQLGKVEEQLHAYVEKEDYYHQLEAALKAKQLAHLHARHVSDALKPGAEDGFPHRLAHEEVPTEGMQSGEDIERFQHGQTRRGMQLRIRRLTRGKQGEDVATMMSTLGVEESHMLDWSEDAAVFVRSLDTLYDRLKTIKKNSSQAKKVASQSIERQKGLVSKNKQLLGKLQESEKHKTQTIQKLLQLISPSPTNTDTEGNHTTLDISENGLENREVALLAGALRSNRRVIRVQLCHNRISDHGVLAIADACLSPSSPVEAVDLQQNLATLDGLEALAFLISEHARAHKSAVSARLTKGEDGSLLPIVQVNLPRKTLSFDLRYNRLQETNTFEGESEEEGEEGGMKRALSRITRLLATCDGEVSADMDSWEGARVLRDWKESTKPSTKGTDAMWGGVAAIESDPLEPEFVEGDEDDYGDEDYEGEPGNHKATSPTSTILMDDDGMGSTAPNSSRSWGSSRTEKSGQKSGRTRELTEEEKLRKFAKLKEQRSREATAKKKKERRERTQALKRGAKDKLRRLTSKDKPARSALANAGPGGLPSLRAGPSLQKVKGRTVALRKGKVPSKKRAVKKSASVPALNFAPMESD